MRRENGYYWAQKFNGEWILVCWDDYRKIFKSFWSDIAIVEGMFMRIDERKIVNPNE